MKLDVSYVSAGCVRLLALATALLFILPGAAQAEDRGTSSTGLMGAGVAVLNLVYVPFKLGGAALGTAVSGLSFLVTFDTDVASPIFWSSVGGDWVVTKEHLRGQEPFRLSGEYRTVRQRTEATPAEYEPFDEESLTEFEG